MRHMKISLLAVAFVALALLSGCAGKQQAAVEKPSWWYQGEIVDAAFVAQYAKVPRLADTLIIDSRPYKTKFVKGFVPSAVSIPASEFDKKLGMLPANKDALLIFYCGGLKCKLSHVSAAKAVKLGYTNVKVFADGFPAWKAAGNYYSIGVEAVADKLAAGEDYLLIDARPAKKYLAGAIPSSVSIPDSKFEAKAGLLPADKSTQLIYYCGGFKCPLSHKSAKKAMALGYTNVVTAEAGYPAWKKMYGGAQAVAVKAGKEEGSIDLAYLEKVLKDSPQSIMLIDVRDADEFKAGHLPGAVNISVDDLEKQLKGMKADKPIVYACATGARSGEAYYMTRDMRPDIKDVFYIEAEIEYGSDGSFTFKKH